MSSKAATWMPLYIGDYLADTLHLSAEEHGAYLLLIMHYWRNGGAIKNDKNLLKNIAKISAKKLENILGFFEEKDGLLFHKRIDEELANATENKEKNQERTRKATEARLQKTQRNEEKIDNVTSNVTFTPSPSPSPLRKQQAAESINLRDTEPVEISACLPAEKIVKIFDEELERAFGAACRRGKPRGADLRHAETFLEAGADPDFLCKIFAERMARLAADGLEPPGGLAYFAEAVPKELAAANRVGGTLYRASEPLAPQDADAVKAKNLAGMRDKLEAAREQQNRNGIDLWERHFGEKEARWLDAWEAKNGKVAA